MKQFLKWKTINK